MASLYVRTSLTARCTSKNIQNVFKQSVDKQRSLATPPHSSSRTGMPELNLVNSLFPSEVFGFIIKSNPPGIFSGLPFVRCVPSSQLHSSPIPVLPPFGGSHAAFRRSSSNSTTTSGGEEPLEPKLQSPYHFSLSSNEEKAQDSEPVHHYHPEPYPEGISDEKVWS